MAEGDGLHARSGTVPLGERIYAGPDDVGGDGIQRGHVSSETEPTGEILTKLLQFGPEREAQPAPHLPDFADPQGVDAGAIAADQDLVNHPPHYTAGGIECLDAIRAALTDEEFRGFCKGNVLKYVWRERHKGGAESLCKAGFYLDRLMTAVGE